MALVWTAQRLHVPAVLEFLGMNVHLQTQLNLVQLGEVVVTSQLWQWAVGIPLLVVFYRISFRL